MDGLTDAQRDAVMAIAEERFGAAVNAHPEIKSADPALVAAIFQAGLEAGCAAVVEVAA